MRKLVILGNGFDLSHGINSKYEHFILNYLYKCLEELNKYENLKTDKSNCSLFYNEYSNELIHLKTKSWTDCGEDFRTSENIDKSNWYNKFKNNKTKNIQELWKQLENYEIIVNNENETSLLNEIIVGSFKGWVDLEVLYYDLLIKIKNSNPTDIDKFDKQWSSLKKEFILYLKHTLNEYYTFIDNNKFNLFKEQYVFKYLFDGYTLGEERKPDFKNYYYLNFNFTDIIEKKYVFENLNHILNHIHGVLDSEDYSDILFGYGNIKHEEYNSLKKERNNSFRKNLKDVYYTNSSNKENLLDWIKESNYIIKIIGHSCGESDESLMNELLIHNNCISIKIYSRDKKEFENIRNNISKFEDFENGISNKIIPFSRLTNNIICQFNPKPPVLNKSYIEG